MELGGNLDLASVAEVEFVAMQSWPGLEVKPMEGWLLRHAAGITRRANSVWPNGVMGDGELEAKLAQVEAFYHERGLPARFQICPAAQPSGLDEWLAERGYHAVARTAVQSTMVADVLAKLGNGSSLLTVTTEKASDLWWSCYTAADDVAAESVVARKAICAEIKLATAYATVMLEGEAIAVGSAAVGDGWVGFFNIATLPQFRRMGAARAVMAALVQWGASVGATRVYLQVMAGNEAALRLYGRLGFETGYYYHYREEVRG